MEFLLAHSAYVILGSFVFLAGLVDSMAGGGGLITLPAYIHFGLPLNLLLGTNKLSSSLGTTVAAFKFLRELDFKKEFLFVLVFFAAMGSFLGAKAISMVPPVMLRYLLVVALPPVAFFIISRHRFGLADHSNELGENALLRRGGSISAVISFYDGMLGPGTGAFLAVALTRFCGYDLLKATALGKLLNLTSNVSALPLFWSWERWISGWAWAGVGMAGNYLGSHIALKRCVAHTPMLFIVANALLVRIVWDMLR